MDATHARNAQQSAAEDPTPGAPVRPGHLPVSEVLYTHAGPGSPFGEDTTLPMPVDEIDYELPDGHRWSDPVDES